MKKSYGFERVAALFVSKSERVIDSRRWFGFVSVLGGDRVEYYCCWSYRGAFVQGQVDREENKKDCEFVSVVTRVQAVG